MEKAIRFHQTGGPEVLKWEDVAVGDPGPGEARIKHVWKPAETVEAVAYDTPIVGWRGQHVNGSLLVNASGSGVYWQAPDGVEPARSPASSAL